VATLADQLGVGRNRGGMCVVDHMDVEIVTLADKAPERVVVPAEVGCLHDGSGAIDHARAGDRDSRERAGRGAHESSDECVDGFVVAVGWLGADHIADRSEQEIDEHAAEGPGAEVKGDEVAAVRVDADVRWGLATC